MKTHGQPIAATFKGRTESMVFQAARHGSDTLHATGNLKALELKFENRHNMTTNLKKFGKPKTAFRAANQPLCFSDLLDDVKASIKKRMHKTFKALITSNKHPTLHNR